MIFNSRLLNLARSERSRLLFTIIIGLSGGVFIILQAYWLSQIINGVFLEGLTLEKASIHLGLLFLAIMLRAGAAWACEVAASKVSLHIKINLREKLFHHLLALGPGYSQGERAGELIHTTTEGIETLDAYFSQYLPQLFFAALVPLTILSFVFPLDLLSGFILLLTAPLIPVFMVLIGNLADALTQKQWQTLSQMSAYFLDVLQGLTTLKILGRSRAQVKVITAISDRYRETTMQVLRVAFLSALSLELVATISTAIVAVEIGLRLLYSTGTGMLGISFQQAFFILLLAPEFYLPLRLLGTRFHAGMSGAAAAARVFEILDTPAAVSNTEVPSARKPYGTSDINRPPSIQFSNVSFTYPDGRSALEQVSFNMESGEVIALVGPSGSGKSSLAQLLLRFLEPQQGHIFIDQEPLDQIAHEQWWKRVAWVSQNPFLFNNTVAANIRLGRPEASMDALVEAAQKARAHEFISGLPEGYETVIGERGVRLSGGEAQRIALARAFLKNAPLIILDEASANLDPETEADLFSGFQQLMQGRTVLIIAHRLATVLQCDRIFVLEKGRLLESGTHSSLATAGGIYHRLTRASIEAPVSSGWSSPDNGSSNQIALQMDDRVQDVIPLSRDADVQDNLPVLLRLIALLAPFKRQILLSAFLGFATIASAIGLMGTSAYIISAAALQPSIADLQVAIVGVRFFGISRGIFRYLERLVSHQVTLHVLSNLRVWFYSALEPLAPARLLQFQSGNLFSRITSDITALENFYVRSAAPPFTAVLVAVGAAAILSFFAPSLALALILFMVLLGVGLPVLMRQLGRQTGNQIHIERAELTMILVDGIQGMGDLLIYGQRELQEKLAGEASWRLSSLQNYMAILSAFQNALTSLLSNLGTLAILILAIPLVSSGQIDGVHLAVLILVALSSFEGVQPLPVAAQYLESHIAAGRRLLELVDARPEVIDPSRPLPIPANPSLAVKRLSFTYPISGANLFLHPDSGLGFPGSTEDIPLALQDISIELPPGKRIAIVGPSGSGKTTLVNLILRFWEYGIERPGSSGQIILNGYELNRYDQNELRSLYGVVSQNTFLFHASVRDNLLIASPGASEEQLFEAAYQADIHDFIQALPQGYDTWIGDQGMQISAGERQRLSIARAILKDARILLLDEPTANLDTLTEMRVLSALRKLIEGRTTLMITHRLVGMEWMDEILVLKAGREIERGRHKDLLEAGGLYRRMWELQNQFLQEAA